MRCARVLGALGLLACLPLSVAAFQDVQQSPTALDSLLGLPVSAASLYAQTRTEAPAQVTVVTSEEIDAFGYRSLAEVLQSVAGFNTSTDLQYAYMGVRGFGRPADLNHRILFLLDGHTINEAVLGATPAGTAFPIGLRGIERVEVIRGPASPLYGTRAMLAVVNVISKKGRDLGGIEAAVRSGSNGTYGASVVGGAQTTGGLEYAFSGTWLDSEGENFYFREFDSPATADGVAAGLGWESYARGNGSASYKGFSALFGGSWREKGIPTAPYGTLFNDDRARTEDVTSFFQLGYERQLTPELRAEGRLYRDSYDNTGQYPFSSGVLEGSFASTETAFEGHVRWDPASSHRVVVGAELQRIHRAEFTQRFISGPDVFVGDSPYSIASVFAQDEVQLTRALALTVGVRHDRYDARTQTTNPRAALVYHPGGATTLKAMYGTAFRAPNVYERELEVPNQFEPNPLLAPERIRTLEFGLEHRISQSVVLQLGLYESRMADLIDQVPAQGGGGFPVLQFQNFSSVTARGLEADVSWSLSRGVQGHARYSLQRAHDRDSSSPISNFPKHALKVGAFGQLRSALGLGVDATFESSRLTVRGRRTDPFWLVNVTARSRPILGRASLVGSVRNVLDSQYALPGGFHHIQDDIVQYGRRLVLEMRVAS